MKKLLYRLKWRFLRPQAFAQYARLMANEKKCAAEIEAEQETAQFIFPSAQVTTLRKAVCGC